MNNTKQCTKCKETKSRSEFYKDKTKKDGLDSRCKPCKSEYQQERAKNLVHQTPDTKQCTKCKEIKAASEFHNHKIGKDGLKSRCKLCTSKCERERTKTIVPVIPETKHCPNCKETKSHSEFYTHKSRSDGLGGVCKPCHAELLRTYREENPEKRAETNRKYYEKNREKMLEGSRKWRQTNPDKVNAKNQRRRARKRNAPGYGNKCLYCGTEENLHIEHRIPLARGGSNHPANLAPACQSCNSSKHTKTETEFKQFLGEKL
jgi:5-methylcytosine-specific restriction endonuclease McrA